MLTIQAYLLGIFLILALLIMALVFVVTPAIEGLGQHATIGGTTVPAVQCAEDEVISWLAPDTLGCVHYEEVR